MRTPASRVVRRWLIEESAQGTVGREALLLDRPERAGAVASPLAWRILQELAKAPDYPNALAARLKVHEQKVYYHVRRLEAAGFLEVVREEPKRGASARILAPTADAFAIVLKRSEERRVGKECRYQGWREQKKEKGRRREGAAVAEE